MHTALTHVRERAEKGFYISLSLSRRVSGTCSGVTCGPDAFVSLHTSIECIEYDLFLMRTFIVDFSEQLLYVL